jgi:hypothetical protein
MSNTLTASPTDRAGYDTHGYAVCRQLIDPALIDQLVAQYEETIVPSRYPAMLSSRFSIFTTTSNFPNSAIW